MNVTGGSAWAVVVIIAIPAVIIAAAELDERLRQRESPLRRAVVTLRTYLLPSFALWALLVPVLGLDRDATGVRLVVSAMVLALSAVALLVLRVFVDEVRRRGRTDRRQGAPELLLALPRLLVVGVAGWILVDSVWGVDLSAALTALGVTSLVVSFALQDTLSGLASGILLLSDQPFTPGDWIRSGDVDGVVVDINWRTTRIRDRNGDILIVPNSQLAGATVVNFSAPERLHRVVVELQVAFVNPPTSAKEMLLDAARGTPGVRLDPPPAVRVIQIDDPLMGYAVDMWIDDILDEPRVRSDFGSLVWYQSHRHGVPLPSPAQDLFIHDGDAAAETVSPARVRAELREVPLLADLPDLDMELLAGAAVPARFAVGETIADSRVPSGVIHVLIEGRARLHLVEADHEDTVVTEAGPGELLTLAVDDLGGGRALTVRAVTDCEVLQIPSSVAAEVSSRHATITEVLNRIATVRRRRVARIVGRREDGSGGDGAADDGAAAPGDGGAP